MSVIMSTAMPTTPADYPKHVALTYAGAPPPREWLSNLQTAIKEKTSINPTIESLEKLDPAGKVAVFVSEVETPFLDDIDSTSFKHVKTLLNESKGVLWLTRGATVDCPFPDLALHTGLLRTRRLEDNSKRYIALDLDPKGPCWSTSSIQNIVDVFAKSFNYATDKNILDFENAIR